MNIFLLLWWRWLETGLWQRMFFGFGLAGHFAQTSARLGRSRCISARLGTSLGPSGYTAEFLASIHPTSRVPRLHPPASPCCSPPPARLALLLASPTCHLRVAGLHLPASSCSSFLPDSIFVLCSHVLPQTILNPFFLCTPGPCVSMIPSPI